jgi:hypothetical protein
MSRLRESIEWILSTHSNMVMSTCWGTTDSYWSSIPLLWGLLLSFLCAELLLHTCRSAAHRDESNNLHSNGIAAQWESEVLRYVLNTMLLWVFSDHSIFSPHIYADNIEQCLWSEYWVSIEKKVYIASLIDPCIWREHWATLRSSLIHVYGSMRNAM